MALYLGCADRYFDAVLAQNAARSLSLVLRQRGFEG